MPKDCWGERLMHTVNMMIKPVSSSCNMRCSYCFYADEAQKRLVANYGLMSESTLECIVRKAFAAADGAVCFLFQGGEPTLASVSYYQTLLQLEKKYNSRNLPVSHCLQTNGLCLPDDLLDVLQEGHFLVGISIDGTKEIHDSRRLDALGNPTFERIVANIKRLQARGIDCNILCVVDDAVAKASEACYQTLKPYGFLQFIACMDALETGKSALSPDLYGQFLIDTFRAYAEDFRSGHYVSIRDFDNWIQMLRGQPPEACAMKGFCSVQFLIESNGDVFPCDFYALDDWQMGNIHQTNFQRMLSSDVAKHFVESSLQTAQECKECKWHFLCRGGCRRYREHPLSTTDLGKNKLCKSYQMFFEASYEQMCEIAKQVR